MSNVSQVFNPCIIVPVYNHGLAISNTLAAISSIAPATPVLLINDGSDADCSEILRDLSQCFDTVELMELPVNGGKGAAVKAGLLYAEQKRYSHALQVDADGQHDIDDIPMMMEQAKNRPQAIICGVPIYNHSVPNLRFYGRYLTHIWVWINTLSFSVKDAMCGYRVYPVVAINHLVNSCQIGNHMDFDVELIVRWRWLNSDMVNFPTKVHYPEGGVSHFRAWQDNVLISKMHAKLFFLMLWQLPKLLWRKVATQEVVRQY